MPYIYTPLKICPCLSEERFHAAIQLYQFALMKKWSLSAVTATRPRENALGFYIDPFLFCCCPDVSSLCCKCMLFLLSVGADHFLFVENMRRQFKPSCSFAVWLFQHRGFRMYVLVCRPNFSVKGVYMVLSQLLLYSLRTAYK